MAIPSRWLITHHDIKWVGFDLKIVVQTDVDCHLTMRYQQHGIEPHHRTKMVRGVPQTKDPHLAFDNYLEMDEQDAGDHKTHRFKLTFPYICKTYYWKFVGTIGALWSPSHSPVFSEHLKEVEPVTKEIYFPVLTNSNSGSVMLNLQSYPIVRCYASGHSGFIPFYVPDNFEALEVAEIIVIPQGTQPNAQWSIRSTYAKVGENCYTNLEADNVSTYSVVDDVLFSIDAKPILSSLAPGQFGGIWFYQRHADHWVRVLGMRFKYE